MGAGVFHNMQYDSAINSVINREETSLLQNATFSFFSQWITRKNCFLLLSIINSALFFFIATTGSNNLKETYQIKNKIVQDCLIAADIFASGLYGAFFFETLRLARLKPRNKEWLLLPFAIISASSFFSAGREGALSVKNNTIFANCMGMLAFLFRNINSI